MISIQVGEFRFTKMVTVTNCTNVNDAWLNFKEKITVIIDSIAPVKEIRVKVRSEPWMTAEILELIGQRDNLLYKSKKRSNSETYREYCKLRNLVQRKVKTAKADYFTTRIEENRNNPKKLWSCLKELGYSNKTKDQSQIVLKIENELCYDSYNVANHINQFFTSVASTLVSKLPSVMPEFGVKADRVRKHYEDHGVTKGAFKPQPVTMEFIQKELSQLNVSKSTGLDGISARFLKDGSDILKVPVEHIVNLSIVNNTVPNDLKTARVSPLYKKNSKLEVGNYRPVSVLSTVSKILEKAVYLQLERYLLDNKLVYQLQSGFRQNYSTNTCLIYLTDYIKSQIATGNYVGLVALDVQKAFDCVDHAILCEKLELMGVDHRWFKSYLSNRKQVTMVNGVQSEQNNVVCGVPQGSLLGPLLYLCYSNDMSISVSCKLLLYADDSILLVSGKDPVAISEQLSTELQSCNRWLIENNLSLHPGKCETILFASKRKCKKVKSFVVSCNGHTIQGQDNIKYLGSLIDHTLSGTNTVNNLVKKSNSKLKFLYRQSKFLDLSSKKTLCSALIQSHLDYACSSWYYSLNVTLQNKLQVIQNKMVRFILNLGPRDHVGLSELSKVGFLPVKDRVVQLSLNLVHSIYQGTCPSYMLENFKRVNSVHSHGTRDSAYNFFVPQVNSITKTTFYYNAIKHWNLLPDRVKSIKCKASFKTEVKKIYVRVGKVKGI